ncbi:MAG: hypothetical protein CMG74_04755 [Candidatus Marinimicrobia bacterium]|nr:hypothetical protein [Candidatus Neomarinimicrobiota bacterium]|tara:strand:- start:3764 stop:4684 length:921 start_codon:yes stop_codon:yes gene_type:complete
MSLYTRIKDFRIFNAKSIYKISPLIISHHIDKELLLKFNNSVIKYLSKSATCSYKLKNEKQLIDYYNLNQKNLNFITPNGAVVPKKETSKEFNLITRNFVNIVKSLKINNYIIKFHIPLNIRIKFRKIPKSYYSRDRATEKPHSDSWAGESSNCVNLHIPIFGDINNNKMEFYHPRKLDEKWLRPLKNFQTGEKYIKYFKKVRFITKKGNLIISDFATLHKTVRKKNCNTRISLDTTFELLRKNNNYARKIHSDRKNEYISFKKFTKLGKNYKYDFKDSIFKTLKVDKGFKHFANYKLINERNKYK